MNSENIRQAQARVNLAAWWLDECFRVPGTPWRFGWDLLLGLVPGLGDWVASLLSLWIMGESFRLRAPLPVLLRMSVNVGVGFLVGLVPLIGDLFDLAWRANVRNARLFRRWTERPEPVTHGSKIWLALFAAVVLLSMIGAVVASAWILQMLWSWGVAHFGAARS